MCISCTGGDGDVQGSKFDESTEVITESGSSLNGEKEKLSQRTKTRAKTIKKCCVQVSPPTLILGPTLKMLKYF